MITLWATTGFSRDTVSNANFLLRRPEQVIEQTVERSTQWDNGTHRYGMSAIIIVGDIHRDIMTLSNIKNSNSFCLYVERHLCHHFVAPTEEMLVAIAVIEGIIESSSDSRLKQISDESCFRHILSCTVLTLNCLLTNHTGQGSPHITFPIYCFQCKSQKTIKYGINQVTW